MRGERARKGRAWQVSDYRHLVVVDIECTCWEPRESQPFDAEQEIIEIGIGTLDLGTLDWLVPPMSFPVRPMFSTVSAFCTSLTGWTDERLATASSLAEVGAAIRYNPHYRDYVWGSWGDFDRSMLTEWTTRLSIPFPLSANHVNLKTLFSLTRGLSGGAGVGRALNVLQREFVGTPHRGVDDVANIGEIAKVLFGRHPLREANYRKS